MAGEDRGKVKTPDAPAGLTIGDRETLKKCEMQSKRNPPSNAICKPHWNSKKDREGDFLPDRVSPEETIGVNEETVRFTERERERERREREREREREQVIRRVPM